MSRTRTEEFFVQEIGVITRGEALRALIAAIYTTAKQMRTFTTDDVFSRVRGYPEYSLRQALAASKLISVALRKARDQGICQSVPGLVLGGPVCHNRRKAVWVSKIADPQYTS